MICRCNSPQEHQSRYEAFVSQNKLYEKEQFKKREAELLAMSPDPNKYEIINVEQVNNHLVMMVKYPSCTKCDFDSKKVMVFLNTPLKNVVFWKHIDPHFTDKKPTLQSYAPSPRARFPGDDQGWDDAIAWAKSKL